MDTATKNGSTTAKKANNNGKVTNGVTSKSLVKETDKTPKVPVKVTDEKPNLSIEQLAMAKLDKQVRLNALIQDVQDLREAKTDLDGIKASSDLRISFHVGPQTVFSTTKSDTVTAALGCVEKSIADKQTLAHQRLVEFEF